MNSAEACETTTCATIVRRRTRKTAPRNFIRDIVSGRPVKRLPGGMGMGNRRDDRRTTDTYRCTMSVYGTGRSGVSFRLKKKKNERVFRSTTFRVTK